MRTTSEIQVFTAKRRQNEMKKIENGNDKTDRKINDKNPTGQLIQISKLWLFWKFSFFQSFVAFLWFVFHWHKFAFADKRPYFISLLRIDAYPIAVHHTFRSGRTTTLDTVVITVWIWHDFSFICLFGPHQMIITLRWFDVNWLSRWNQSIIQMDFGLFHNFSYNLLLLVFSSISSAAAEEQYFVFGFCCHPDFKSITDLFTSHRLYNSF